MNNDKPFFQPIRQIYCLLLIAAALFGQDTAVPSPREHFGFDLGSDRRLLSWAELSGYYQRLADTSPYVRCESIGTTTEGRPMLLLTVSSRSDEQLRSIEIQQRRMLAPTDAGILNADELAAMPAVVYIQGTLHSTEIAASLLFPDLLYRIATGADPMAQRIRDEVVLLVAPSANPDGIDLVNTWHTQTLGTPWEGTTPPDLYQTYAGHDNNRDWFMLSLQETRLVTKLLYQRWLPEVVLDIHQMGANGARMFVPPCSDPLNDNIPAMVTRQIDLVGAHMAWALQQAGCSGVVQDVVYDNYWAGGARNTPCRHNMVGIITETASARLASPMVVERKDLRGHGGGLPEYRRQGNFPDPWPGGTWRMQDILRYQTVSTLAMLDLVARFRESFVMDFFALNREAVRRGNEEAPGAFVLPTKHVDPAAVTRLVNILLESGVTVHQIQDTTTAASSTRTDGDIVVLMAQPFRNHAKDLLEPQQFPEVRFTRNGDVTRPYDTAGWCLPQQFGLPCVALDKAPAGVTLRQLRAPWTLPSSASGTGNVLRWSSESNAAFVFANRLRHTGFEVRREIGGEFVAQDVPSAAIDATVKNLGLHVSQLSEPLTRALPTQPLQRRVAIFQSWPASMDGGWTRLVLEEHGYKPRMLTATEINGGALFDAALHAGRSIDTLIIPDISPRNLAKGADKDRLPPTWLGGLEGVGTEALQRFAKSGGRIVSMGSSVEWLIQALELPLENGLAQAPREGPAAFACPGSLLQTNDTVPRPDALRSQSHWLTRSTPTAPIVYFEGTYAMRCIGNAAICTPLLSFPEKNALRSGYIEGEKLLAGLHALVECRVGAGHAVLFSMRPQHRSQTLGTFRLLFEAIEGP